MGFWLLAQSHSKTALICVLLGAALLVRGRRFNSVVANTFAFVGALSLPLIVLLTQEFKWLLAPLVGAIGRDLTFTGRTEIWSHITLATVNPLIGAGFWSFWGGKGGTAIKHALQTGIPSAHNGYLDIYLDGGFIGLALLCGLIWLRGRGFIRDLNENRRKKTANLGVSGFQQFRFAVLVVAIIYNISESAFARPIFIWFTTLLILYEFPQVKESARRFRGKATVSQDAPQVLVTESVAWTPEQQCLTHREQLPKHTELYLC
jgi:O-antigen ligase